VRRKKKSFVVLKGTPRGKERNDYVKAEAGGKRAGLPKGKKVIRCSTDPPSEIEGPGKIARKGGKRVSKTVWEKRCGLPTTPKKKNPLGKRGQKKDDWRGRNERENNGGTSADQKRTANQSEKRKNRELAHVHG